MRERVGRTQRAAWSGYRLLLGLALLAAFGGLSACDTAFDIAVGPNQDVELFSDFPAGDPRTEWVAGALTRLVEAPVRPEAPFQVLVTDSTAFERMNDWRNLVLLGDLGGSAWAARMARRILGREEVARLVAAGPGYRFTRDVWARGQTVLFIHAPQPGVLDALPAGTGERLVAQLEERVIEGLGKTIFTTGEQEAMASGLAKRHGYQLRIPEGFFVEEDPDNRFVRIKRIEPGEPVLFLFVYYEPARMPIDDPRLPSLCVALRDTLAAHYFGGDWVEPARTTTEPTIFAGYEAVEVYGLYQNDAPMGGPFRLYGFQVGERLYLIDLAVYNPPGGKLSYLRQLEAIARTFEVVDPPAAPR